MQSETCPRTSFFDDDDANLRFEFVKPEKNHLKYLSTPAIIKTGLSKHPANIDPSEKTVYALHSRLLVIYEDMSSKVPLWILDLAHSRLEVQPPTEGSPYSFGVVRNGNTFRFYSADKQIIENWTTALRTVCVLLNFHDEYKALKMIGKGSFAKVYLVESKNAKKNFAVKAFTKEGLFISNKSNAKPAMLNEIEIMRALDHENVIKLYEVYETEKSIYLVLELIQGKSLQEMLKKGVFKEENSEIKIINTVRSILDALAYLATKGVMHRDLKPDNILLDKGEKVKIVDFGLSTFIDVPDYIFKKCGTPGYIAPEVFKYDVKVPATAYNSQCDVFSIGCILYYMYFGKAFFEGSNASEILKCNRRFTPEYEAINIAKKELKDPDGKISKEGLNLLLHLLEFDPKKRPTAVQALNHSYFTPVPTGMHKIPGFSECVADDSRTDCYSPTVMSSIKAMTPISSSPDKSPYNVDRRKYTQKDSLYLDVGKSTANGKIETISNTHNSLLFANRITEQAQNNNNDGSSASLSPFGKGMSGHFKRPSSKTFHGQNLAGNNFGFSKAVAQRNEEHKDDGSPSPMTRLEQEKFGKNNNEPFTGTSTQPSSEKLRFGSQSPEYRGSHLASSEMSPFQLKIEQVQSNPTRSGQSGTRRYQPFAQKN